MILFINKAFFLLLPGGPCPTSKAPSNQITLFLLAYEAVQTIGWGVGVYGKGHLGEGFLRESMCAEGMSCGRRWVRWVLRGTGIASGHPGVS